VEADQRKKSPEDFVLWFSQSKFPDQVMKWESPWGVGFPGWHIECSAMSAKYLGDHFDIHCGGVDHITMHHTNEIAQAEGCFCQHLKNGTHWVNYWIHEEFLLDQISKMSKSKGNFLTLDVFQKEGVSPMAYRLFLLQGHYRTQMSMNWDVLKGCQKAYEGMRGKMQEWDGLKPIIPVIPIDELLARKQADLGNDGNVVRKHFYEAMANDMNTPMALVALGEAFHDPVFKLSLEERKSLVIEFDQILSLGLSSVQKGSLSAEERGLLDARAAARKSKDFKKSDELRGQLESKGIVVKDTAKGQEWTRK
jgi:cysteinyl-tRNA synthetase